MNKLPLTYVILRCYIVVLSLLLFLQVFASLSHVLDQNKLSSIYLFLFFYPSGWLSTGQPSPAGLLSHHPLRVWKHPQGLCLQAAFQVPRLLLQIGERIHFWEVHLHTCATQVPAGVLSPWCQRVDMDLFVCLQVDGSDPQCHGSLQEHSCPQQQRVQPSLSPLWFYSGPPSGGICNPSHLGLCFSLLHISRTFIHVSMHIWCFF